MFRSKKPEEPAGAEPPRRTAAPTSAQVDAFLGTLRSEFDEPEVVPAGFLALSESAEAAVEAYKDGRIEKQELAERMSRLRANDSTGGEWTVGASTLRWFRRQGGLGSWIPVPPPSQAIGEPLPGEWMKPLPLPEKGETSTDAPRSEETPAPEAEESPITYADTFDAGLAALLEAEESPGSAPEDVPPPAARVAPSSSSGPAPRVPVAADPYADDETPERGTDEVRTPEVASTEVPADEVRTPEVASTEVPADEVRTPEVASTEVPADEVRTPEVDDPLGEYLGGTTGGGSPADSVEDYLSGYLGETPDVPVQSTPSDEPARTGTVPLPAVDQAVPAPYDPLEGYLPSDASPLGDLDNDTTVDTEGVTRAAAHPHDELPAPSHVEDDRVGVPTDEPGLEEEDFYLPPELFWDTDEGTGNPA